MPGKVEDTDASAGTQPVFEVGQRFFHGRFGQVAAGQHLEARLAQQLRHIGGVVARVGQGAVGIGGVANDQRHAARLRFGWRLGLAGQGRQQAAERQQPGVHVQGAMRISTRRFCGAEAWVPSIGFLLPKP